MMKAGVPEMPALDARSASLAISGRVACVDWQLSNAIAFSDMVFANRLNIVSGFVIVPQRGCALKSESCIVQNFPCTDAHIAASAAGQAFWWLRSGMFTYAIRALPLSIYAARTAA